VSGTKSWPPFVAIIAKLRQVWQPPAKCNPGRPSFPIGTKFFDVEGVPVSVGARLLTRAWDVAAARPFPTDSAWRNGTRISEVEFFAMLGPSLPIGTNFFDVDGVPVSVSPDGETLAWDVPTSRRFQARSAHRDGSRISEIEFFAMIQWAREGDLPPWPGTTTRAKMKAKAEGA
jgi:hypothetical protein